MRDICHNCGRSCTGFICDKCYQETIAWVIAQSPNCPFCTSFEVLIEIDPDDESEYGYCLDCKNSFYFEEE